MSWDTKEERNGYTHITLNFSILSTYNKTEVLTPSHKEAEPVSDGKGLLNATNATCEGQVLAFLGPRFLDWWKSVHFCHLEPSVLFVTVSGREICNC